MKVCARLNNLKSTPRKMRLVAHTVAGLSVADATIELSKQVRRGSDPMAKLLKSAVANAENNFGLDPGNLYVASVVVNEGTRLKRSQPRAFGRATTVLRRLSKITLTLDERVEGMNRRKVKPGAAVVPVEAPTESEREAESREAEASQTEHHLQVEEKKRDTAMKAEVKDRTNAVKRTYQRKSF
jgi:large subunit ribosomal protein L22